MCLQAMERDIQDCHIVQYKCAMMIGTFLHDDICIEIINELHAYLQPLDAGLEPRAALALPPTLPRLDSRLICTVGAQ
jgi:hypothetical protein